MRAVLPLNIKPGLAAGLVSVSAMVFFAVAMGVGRFAFTPLFPLMVLDGLITSEAGAWLAGSNYLGYLVGALLVAWIRLKPPVLLTTGLITIVVVTAAIGWTTSFTVWAVLRFIAGVMSAWSLVALSAWGLAWLASVGRPNLSGVIFAGVGLGITIIGLFCLVVPAPGVTSLMMWVQLALYSAVAVVIPLTLCWLLPVPAVAAAEPTLQVHPDSAQSDVRGLIICYTLFGFGYILPATFLPELARQLVDDPKVFGLAWPVFGLAAALSTVIAARILKNSNRVTLWARCHIALVVGVLLPAVWPSLVSVVIAALCVGGTFAVITMLGFQEARVRAGGHATVVLGQMTAGFAFGQLMGPIASGALGHFIGNYSIALNLTMALSAAGLFVSAIYLYRLGKRSGSQ